jgi:hypothetical protein
MLADNSDQRDVVSFVANEDLPFGRFVRLRADGKVELPKDDTLPLVGVTLYVNTLENSYPTGGACIKAGQVVAILRKGRVWAGYDNGGTIAGLTAVQLKNDVATAASQGMVTGSAASAGITRTLGGRVLAFDGQKTTTMALVEVNLP